MIYRGEQRYSEDGIAHVDTTTFHDFTRKQLAEVTNKIENGRRVTIDDADQMLETRFNPVLTQRQRLARTFIPAASLITAATALKIGIEVDPGLSVIGTLPSVLDSALNAIWDHIPFDNPEAMGNGVIDQVPPALSFVALFGATTYAAYKTLRRTDDSEAKIAQRKLRSDISDGKQWWDTENTPNAVVAYVDSKESVPESIAQTLGHRTIVMTHQADVSGATVLFPEDGGLDRTSLAFQQAGASRTTHAVIYTGSTNDIFPDLEDRTTFAIGVARAEGFIKRLDECCADDPDPLYNTRQIPVTIIGSREQPLLTATATDSVHVSTEPQHETLASRIGALGASRTAPTRIIDPTDVTLNAIFHRAHGRPLHLVGSPLSNERYAESFFAATEARPGIDYAAPPIDVIFSDSDRMTSSVLPQRDSIYVVRDPKRGEIIEKDVLSPGSSVVVIADVLQTELGKYIPL